MRTSYDVVGDSHGQGLKFEALLSKLGYTPAGRGYRAPQGRQLLVLGDMIDRGPEQARILEIVRAMVESGDALCLMGNHEFNAIAYVTEDPHLPGQTLRRSRGVSDKSIQNRRQHAEFLAQVGEGSAAHKAWVNWFRTLPLFLDLGGIRAVHACWDANAIAYMNAAGWVDGTLLTDERLVQSVNRSTAAKRARKILLCGMEHKLPKGQFFLDKAGHARTEVRIANWRKGCGTLREVALVPKDQAATLDGEDTSFGRFQTEIEGAPIFIGHHWFSGKPAIESPKLACLDWSSAAGGPQVAYRWDGEEDLTDDHLVWI